MITREIGIAIPAHNRIERTRECLLALRKSTISPQITVVVDDGSTDGTSEVLANEFPEVSVINGNGELWWAGATNLAVEKCLQADCSHVFLLNQDCVVGPDAIEALVQYALDNPSVICAAINVDLGNPERVLWAGTKWTPSRSFPWAYYAQSVVERGSALGDLPTDKYCSDLTGGRGLLVPAAVFHEIGYFDCESLPQYGADNDFSLRARRAGYGIHVLRKAVVATRDEDSVVLTGRGEQSFFRRLNALLFDRKNGESVRVWWLLARRHTPTLSVLPTFVRAMMVTVKRAYVESRN